MAKIISKILITDRICLISFNLSMDHCGESYKIRLQTAIPFLFITEVTNVVSLSIYMLTQTDLIQVDDR